MSQDIPATLTFYYTNPAAISQVSVLVTISAYPEDPTKNSILLVLMLTAGIFVILYGLLSLARICIRATAERRHRRQQRQWIDGAPARMERLLKDTTVSSYDPKQNKYLQTSCTVCLADFQQGCELRKLACEHIFHKECIDSWIKSKISEVPRCPICNVELTGERPPSDLHNVPPTREDIRQRQATIENLMTNASSGRAAPAETPVAAPVTGTTAQGADP